MNAMSVQTIFQPTPIQWGLRGDPQLWKDLEEYFLKNPIPIDLSDKRFFERIHEVMIELVYNSTEFGVDFSVDRYEAGGLSSGMISARFWEETAIPLLLDRLHQLQNTAQEQVVQHGIQTIAYKNFIHDWLVIFPEFKKSPMFDSFSVEENLPYIFLGDFMHYVMPMIESGDAESSPAIVKLFEVVNNQFDRVDRDAGTIDLLGVEIFEKLVGSTQGIAICRKLLTSEAAIVSCKASVEYCGVEQW